MADHSGHRKHLRERFVNEGLANFPEHTALELLLTYILMSKLVRLAVAQIPQGNIVVWLDKFLDGG